MKTLTISEADLHARLDGQLPMARQAELAAYLAQHPEEEARLAAYRAQNRQLHALFDSVLDEPVPAPLLLRRRRRFPYWSQLLRVAAMLVIGLSGLAAGWIGRGLDQDSALAARGTPPLPVAGAPYRLVRQAALAHAVYSPEVRHPVEVGADQEADLIAWLSKRLGTAIHPPQLGQLGYDLVGGRLLSGDAGPVAQFMYQNGAGQRLTLYLSAEQGQPADAGFRYAQEGSVNVFYWIDGKYGYALSASISRAELGKVAAVVYQQWQSSHHD